LRKTPIFSPKKLSKIAENCDHNIDPRRQPERFELKSLGGMEKHFVLLSRISGEKEKRECSSREANGGW
jgi:hypothetical protein